MAEPFEVGSKPTGKVKGLPSSEAITQLQKLTLAWQYAVQNGKHSYAGTVVREEKNRRYKAKKAAKQARKAHRGN